MTPSQEIKLYEYLHGLDGLPFEYGHNDCPLLAAGVLDCMDGGVRRSQITGLWHDRASAWRYLRKNGDIHAHLLDAGCTEDPRGIQYAQPGDLLLLQRELAHDKRWHSVAVCVGTKAVVMAEEAGLIYVSIHDLPTVKQVMRWP